MKVSSLNDITSVAAYLARVGAEPRSLKSAVVREVKGSYWKDLAIIRFNPDGTITCTTDEHAPTDAEAAAIVADWATIIWPDLKLLDRIIKPPKVISQARPEDVFEFRNADKKIVMVQVRVNRRGEKAYVPFTYWSDDMWRSCEPDGALPLFNAEKLEESSTVFVHEGAKAARHVQWMVEGETAEARQALAAHPWGRELSAAVHLGWIGGALSPQRTDWTTLHKSGIKRVYIVADNDEPGRAAVPKIAQQLRIPTFTLQFTDEFPASFDLADKFPDTMFGDETKFYIGPSFRDCLHPATWATDLIQLGKGRPTALLRDSFVGMWSYVEEADLFVCNHMPEILRTEAVLNKMLAPFSHVSDTCRLIVKAYQGRSARLCYRPDHDGLVVTSRGSSAINLHVKSSIKAVSGDITPWENFLSYMFPNERELHQVKRWLATLIARPDVRMGYGLLLISESQGIGKTTLGSHVLAPLVGVWNVGFPSENDINSDFNDWVAHKRLAVISEIYSGSSWKAYHALKSVVTDRELTVNQKYMRQYVIENWCHVLACSNSMRALKMEHDDRRWFYPEVSEVPWHRAKFAEFRRWIEGGGLSIIKHWAEQWGDYVAPNERAPMTERKKEMIEGSRSESQREAAALAEAVAARDEPVAIVLKDVAQWCRNQAQGRVFDTDYELKRAMTEVGLTAYGRRIKVGPRMEYVLANHKLAEIIREQEDVKVQADLLRKHVRRCSEIMEGMM